MAYQGVYCAQLNGLSSEGVRRGWQKGPGGNTFGQFWHRNSHVK